MRLVAIMIFLVAGCSASRSPEKAIFETDPQQGTAKAPLVYITNGLVPLLQTDEVIRIACEAARKRRFKIDDYICEAMIFEGTYTNGHTPRKWLLHFVPNLPSPDLDFWVTVEDGSGRTELHGR